MISNINICCCDTRLLLLLLIMILFTFDFYHYLFYLFWSLNLFSCSCWSEVSADVPQWSTLKSLRVSVWIKFDWSVAVTSTLFDNHVMFLGARFSESFFHHWNIETGTNQNHGSEPRAVSAVKIRVSIKTTCRYWRKAAAAHYLLADLHSFKLFVFVWRRAAGRTTAEQTASCRPLWPQSTFIYTFQQYVSRMCARRLEAQNRPPAVILC